MLKDFRESFAGDLRDPEFQKELIASAYAEEGPDGILNALRLIGSANRDMTRLAAQAGVARTSLYRSLRPQANPAFKTVRSALNALGLDFAIVAKDAADAEGVTLTAV
jgi:probable addiction module antidote protein